MLTKEERKERNILFWTGFQKEMRKVKSSNGRSINWVSYPTDVKDVYIRLETDGTGARLCFDIQPKDNGIRAIIWEQMTELKKVMETELGEATRWNEFNHVFNGRNVSRIYWENTDVNFFNKDDWDEISRFLSDKLIHFDAFYQEYKDILIALME